jgi:cytochrome c peroxidase
VRIFFAVLSCSLAAAQPAAAQDSAIDLLLGRVIRDFAIRPLPTKPFEETAKFRLGRALFFDPILSGNRDVSCGTCHLVRHSTTDRLPFSIGTGGSGLGKGRIPPPGRAPQPRNALDLWNRDNNAVRNMFWDGRVEVLDPARKLYRSPLGERLPGGLENAMAVQALFPLAREDEMLGVPGDRSAPGLPAPHANRPNEIAAATAHLSGEARIEAVLRLIVARLLGARDGAAEPWQAEYLALFKAAYPHADAGEYSIAHMANALSHFEEIAFATRRTPFDAYVNGDVLAIPPEAKRGALLFFGRARCVVCHRGPLFSDFEFHSVGVRNFGPGTDGKGNDLGRYTVTGRAEDKYKFRTPPLRNVTLTAPYFHNGSAQTLEEAILQHVDPLYYADKYQETGAFAMNRDQINAVSPVLIGGVKLAGDEIKALIAFLRSLEDRGPKEIDRIVPAKVPSGLPVPESKH